MARTWAAREVVSLIASRPQWGARTDAVRHLGSGESYAAFAAEPVRGGPPLVIRVARRPRAELPADPGEEFAGLRLAPPGIGPVPILLDAVVTDNGRGGGVTGPEPGVGTRGPETPGGGTREYPVLIESLVPGRVLPPRAWTDAMRRATAGVLARLHERAFPGPGAASAAGAIAPGRVSYVAAVEGAIEHWTPRLSREAEREWAVHVAPMRRYAAEVEPEVAEVTTYALLHGDPALTNILVHPDDSSTRLVDWEWTHIGDPARDLGFLGGAVAADPWYAALSERQIADLVSAYVDAGGRGEPAALIRRRDAWLAAEGFAVLAYLLWLDADPTQRATPLNRETVRGLRATLRDVLAPYASGPGRPLGS